MFFFFFFYLFFQLTSLQSSKSGHYILTTSRKDKYSQLWDLRFMKTLHPVVSYSFRVSSLPPSSSASSLSSSPPTQAPSSVCFSWDESFVYGITPGKSTPSSIRGWNTRTGEQVIYFESSHQSHVSLILSSPTENAVATGGDDNKLKMWFSA
jgi:WD40 repeat protein